MSLTKLPIAPEKPALLQRLLASRLGRKDAKRYSKFGDETITHSIRRFQARAQQGQHRVNEWVHESGLPFAKANKQISAQQELLSLRITQLSNLNVTTGREKRKNSELLLQLRNQVAANEGQIKSNLKEVQFLLSRADSAMNSWASHYDSLASIYIRSLRRNQEKEIPAAPSKVPPFTSIPLVDLSDILEGDVP